MIHKIKVLEQHVINGKRSECGMCPVALAIYSQTKIAVFVHHGRALRADTLEILAMPSEVYRKIFDYDKTGKMEPFEFECEIP